MKFKLEDIMKLTSNPLDYSYPVIKSSFGCRVDVLDEWIKWLSFNSPEDEAFIERLADETLNDIDQEDLDRYLSIKSQLNMRDLFIKYKEQNCTKNEHDKVFGYMHTSIDSLMDSKMSEEEKEEANRLFLILREQSDEELQLYIENGLANYGSLGKVDAYLLRQVSIYRYNRICDETNERIMREKLEREASLRKSLVRDYGNLH